MLKLTGISPRVYPYLGPHPADDRVPEDPAQDKHLEDGGTLKLTCDTMSSMTGIVPAEMNEPLNLHTWQWRIREECDKNGLPQQQSFTYPALPKTGTETNTAFDYDTLIFLVADNQLMAVIIHDLHNVSMQTVITLTLTCSRCSLFSISRSKRANAVAKNLMMTKQTVNRQLTSYIPLDCSLLMKDYMYI